MDSLVQRAWKLVPTALVLLGPLQKVPMACFEESEALPLLESS